MPGRTLPRETGSQSRIITTHEQPGDALALCGAERRSGGEGLANVTLQLGFREGPPSVGFRFRRRLSVRVKPSHAVAGRQDGRIRTHEELLDIAIRCRDRLLAR